MTIDITTDNLDHLAPSAQPCYRQGFAGAPPVLDRFGISQSALRVAHFMAQVLYESCNFTVLYENLNYSAPGLAGTWPRHFKPQGPLDPNAYAHNPQLIADTLYGVAINPGLGNTGPTDGFTYRGRGLLQLTGRSNYAQATAMLRKFYADAPDFVAGPDQVLSADWCLVVAAAKWSVAGCNAMADADDVTAVTKAINGGLIGLPGRQADLVKTKAIWH